MSENSKDLATKTIEALKKNKFSASYHSDAQEALDNLFAAIPLDATVGIGGSWTLMQLEVAEKLEERGNVVYCHHKPGLSSEEILDIRRKQLTCDVFITSSNAITEDGKLVGDVAPGADGHVEALSPVPGGVGPITVSLLLANLLLCATRRRLGKSMMLPDLRKLREE